MPALGVRAAALKKDRCTRFAGNTGSAYMAMSAAGIFNFERTDSFSIYLWLRWTQASIGVLAARSGEVSARKGWNTYVRADGSLAFTVKNAGSPNALGMFTTAGGYNDGKWHSLIWTYGGTSSPAGVHIYVDNVDKSLTTGVDTLTDTIVGGFFLNLGVEDVAPTPFPFTGDVGGLAILSGVVDSTARGILHNGRKGPPSRAAVLALPGILGHWRMGEGGAAYPTIPDETGGVSGGTLNGLSGSALKTYGPPYA